MVTDPHKSLATNPVNLKIMLQSTLSRFTSDYQSTSIWSSIGFHFLLQNMRLKDVGSNGAGTSVTF
jgi:hypothetical protein